MSAEECAAPHRALRPAPPSLDARAYNNGAAFRTSRTSFLSHLEEYRGGETRREDLRALGIRVRIPKASRRSATTSASSSSRTGILRAGHREYLRFAGVRGNRSWTFMVYLNDGMEGGATRFTEFDRAVHPKLGMALLWNNLNPGRLNQRIHHALRRTGDPRPQEHHHQVVQDPRRRAGVPRIVSPARRRRRARTESLHDEVDSRARTSLRVDLNSWTSSASRNRPS